MSGKRILIVDDSATVRQQVSLALRQVGFQVLEAVDGQEGAETIERQTDISMVICDVNMPRMNGLEMLERVKGGGQRPQLPVIMLTTEGQPALIKRAKAAGAKGWIVKPFKADQLVAAARKLTAA
ncbi:MAG: response regulator [Bradymonadia bacterium]